MLLRPGHFKTPTPPETLFERRGPLCVEIGVGHGHFLSHLAAHNPDVNLLGVDMSPTSARRTLRRFQGPEHGRVRVALATGQFIVRNVLPPDSLDRLYVNFPEAPTDDPDRSHPLVQPPFFRLLGDRLTDQGSVHLTTDRELYFQDALDSAEQTGLFDSREAHPPVEVVKSRYGHRGNARDDSIHHAVFHKAADADTVAPQIQARDTMHHAIVAGHLPDIDQFDQKRRPLEDGQTVVLDAFRDASGERLLFTARTEEPGLTQDVLVEVYASDNTDAQTSTDRLVVRLKPFNHPLLTDATAEAVEMVADWVAETHEDNEITERRY